MTASDSAPSTDLGTGLSTYLSKATEPCPCDSGQTLSQCCGAIIEGAKVALSPEALMRSRYCAFALGIQDYLLATWHSSTRPSRVRLDDEQKWIGLKIKSQQWQNDADQGEVEFIARFKVQGKAHKLHERSRFTREAGQWYYIDGQHFDS